MTEIQTYTLIAAFIGYIIYRIFKFVKRKIRWVIASLPVFAMGGFQLPPGKMQQLLALLT